MKTKFFLHALLIFAAICLCASCTNGGSSSQSQQESFWEGKVRPGTYSGTYVEDLGFNRLNYKITVTIEENQDVEIREVCNSETKVFYGTLHKYVETYDGERKVWYGAKANQDGGSWETRFNLSTSLEYSTADCTTYQEYSNSRKECTLH